jgi:hypothetical protein
LLALQVCEIVTGALTRSDGCYRCLDVRSNDQGDVVVTKGDQYDVREAAGDGNVRNMGKPVDLCTRYYHEVSSVHDSGHVDRYSSSLT